MPLRCSSRMASPSARGVPGTATVPLLATVICGMLGPIVAAPAQASDVALPPDLQQVIDDNAYKVKTGLFSNWYARVKKEVGVA